MIGSIYSRISIDDEGDGKGVARQVRICQGLARERGIEVPDELIFDRDNDITGSGEKRRPDYERLIETVRVGRVGAVVTTEVERLQRGLREYLEFFEAAEAQKLLVVWDGGSANFATGDGIDALEDRATDARKELRKIRRRVRRKHEELLQAGKYVGQHRAFGYRWDGERKLLEIVESEATLIREAVERVLSGEALNAICRDWNRRGVLTIERNPWSQRSLKRMLVSGRISGRRDYGIRSDGGRMAIPRIVADGDWPAIIDAVTSDRVRARLEPNSRPSAPRRHLLTGGLTRCALCGAGLQPQAQPKVKGGVALYCRRGQGYHGCGGVSMAYQALEELVTVAVLNAVDEGALARALHAREQDAGTADELAAVEGRLDELARDWAGGEITRSEWQAARAALVERQAALSRALEAQRRRLSIDGLDEQTPLRDQWPAMPLHRKHAVLGLLLDKIEIRPAAQRGIFDADRISLHWRV